MLRIFVYGTLRKAEVNHYLLEGAAYLGEHRTLSRYKMLHLGAYPGVIEGGSTPIQGEVYRIDRAHLAKLDRLEDYPRLYTRKLIQTPWGRAWIYLYQGSKADRELIGSGNWQGRSRQHGAFSLY